MIRLTGFHRPRPTTACSGLTVTAMERPDRLRFLLATPTGQKLVPLVAKGDAVEPFTVLARWEDRPYAICPVKGTVTEFTTACDAHGHQDMPVVVITVDADQPSEPRHFASAREAVDAAGILIMGCTGLAMNQCLPTATAKALAVTAMDLYPGVHSAASLLARHGEACVKAAALAGSLVGVTRTVLVLPDGADAAPLKEASAAHKVEIHHAPVRYPLALPPLLIKRLEERLGITCAVMPLSTAFAAYKAAQGTPPSAVMVTVTGHTADPRAMLAPLGATVGQVLSAAGQKVEEGDKVVTAGPLTGQALCNLETPVEAGLSGLHVIPRKDVVETACDPCINCGVCLEVCPTGVQVHMIGRYAQYNIFDRAQGLGIKSCIDCGLCASVCPSHRPLLQWINLTRSQMAAAEVRAQ